VLGALALLAGGGALTWAVGSQRDGDGYFTTHAHHLQSPTYAIASDTLDVDTGGPRWAFGDHFARVRIRAASADPSRAIFIGIGRTADVRRYLTGTAHDDITDLDTDPFRLTYRRARGARAPSAPGEQTFWRARATGPGSRTLTWPVENGRWSAVVMNADAGRSVSISARLGARVPALRWIGIGLLAAGGLALLGGGALLYSGLRTRST
jgi:hypothetical protein